MKNMLLLICAIAFFTAGLVSVVHADVSNLSATCSHHVTDLGDTVTDCSGNPAQDQTNLEQCQDCCCIHSHALTGPLPTTTNLLKKRMALSSYSLLRSSDNSPLYRPPIA